LAWIRPTGVTNAELKQNGIVWSDSWNRLIFPIYSIHTEERAIRQTNMGDSTNTVLRVSRHESDTGDIRVRPRPDSVSTVDTRESTLGAYQARTFDPITVTNPKYRNARQVGIKSIYFRRNQETSNNLVIVEDILSAIKVGRYCNSLALLGSYVPDDLITKLQKYEKIFIWLDYDKLSSSYKYAKRIKALTGLPVKVIITKEDPKYINDTAIKQHLEVLP
jgi:hypothetical protein